METFGSTLRRLRLDNQKTLREVSYKVGISISYLSDIEHGRRSPPNSELVDKLSKVLGDDTNLKDKAQKHRSEGRGFNYVNINHPYYKELLYLYLDDMKISMVTDESLAFQIRSRVKERI